MTVTIETQQAQTALGEVTRYMDALSGRTVYTKVVTRHSFEGMTPVEGGTPGGWERAAPSGFASSGYTGSLGISQIAGVVHGREHVIRAAMVAQPGARAFLDLFNKMGMAALPAWIKTVKLPGFKDGGFVVPLPKAAQPASGSASADRMIPAVFNIPNVGKVPVSMDSAVSEQLARTLKIEALMRGGRR